LVTAPANGGSGFGESVESDATCPAGTFVIGTGAFTTSGGIEDSEIFATSVNSSPAPNRVAGFFDNFTNTAHAGQFVEAICASLSSPSNPGALTAKSAR
jgi:hypothetical protein